MTIRAGLVLRRDDVPRFPRLAGAKQADEKNSSAPLICASRDPYGPRLDRTRYHLRNLGH
jgi:hypothetical protein